MAGRPVVRGVGVLPAYVLARRPLVFLRTAACSSPVGAEVAGRTAVALEGLGEVQNSREKAEAATTAAGARARRAPAELAGPTGAGPAKAVSLGSAASAVATASKGCSAGSTLAGVAVAATTAVEAGMALLLTTEGGAGGDHRWGR